MREFQYIHIILLMSCWWQQQTFANTDQDLLEKLAKSSMYAYCSATETSLKETEYGNVTCQNVFESNRFCKDGINVGYAEFAPYVYRNESGHVIGLLPELLYQVLVRRCCLDCTSIHYHERPNLNEMLWHQFNTTTPPMDIVFPIELRANGIAKKTLGHHYVKQIKVLSVFFVGKNAKPESQELFSALFQSTLQTWPLFVIAISMAVCAGTIMWLMDRWMNEEHFPKTFPKGPFEGFWWAYVSMTTVGYGDRTPSTIFGRLFAVVWILIGITIFNMFTATITSVLNAELRHQTYFSPYNKKIGMVKDLKVVKSSIIRESGLPKAYDDVFSMVQAFKNGDIEVIAMDRLMYEWALSKKLLPKNEEIKWTVLMSTEALGFACFNEHLRNMQEEFNENSHETLYQRPHALGQLDKSNEHKEYSVVEILQASDKSFVYSMLGVACLSIFCVFVGVILNEKKWKASRAGFQKLSKRWQDSVSKRNSKSDETRYGGEVADDNNVNVIGQNFMMK